MGAPSRDVRNAAAASLLDYGFANYKLYTNDGEKIKNIPISKGVEPYINAEYASFFALVKKGDRSEVKAEIKIPEEIKAPIKKGDVIGEVIYSSKNGELGKRDIIATDSVEKITFGAMLLTFIRKCATIV